MSLLRQRYAQAALPPTTPYASNLTLDGTKTGDFLMNQDFSGVSGPVRFYVRPVVDHNLQIGALFLALSDNGDPAITDFANGPPLTVGMRFFIESPGGIVYDDVELKTNQDLVRTATEISELQFSNQIRVLRYRRQYVPFSGCFQLHYRHPEDRFGVELHDDFSSIVEMSMYADGAQILAQANN